MSRKPNTCIPIVQMSVLPWMMPTKRETQSVGAAVFAHLEPKLAAMSQHAVIDDTPAPPARTTAAPAFMSVAQLPSIPLAAERHVDRVAVPPSPVLRQ